MKIQILLLASLPLICNLSSCSKSSSSAPPTTANMMFVNGCAGSVSMNVDLNGAGLTNASNIAFLQNTGYDAVASGTDNLSLLLAATGTPLASASESLATGANYSLYASGLVTGASAVFTIDDLTTPAAGDAKIRFINLSSDTLSESFFLGSSKMDSSISYQLYTPFFEVAAGTMNVQAQDPAHLTSSLALLSNQSFSAGKIYTIMLTGTHNATSGSTSALTLTVVHNN